MFENIMDLKIQYRCQGKGENIILLHGWGGNLDSFAPVFNHLSKNFRVYTLDFPGFGKSQRPQTTWGTEDYSKFLKAFMDKMDIKKAVLIGHSFGGRVAIRFASANPQRVSKMILVNSAGLIKKRSLSYHLKVRTYKILKQFLMLLPGGEKHVDRLRSLFGSKDYKQAGPMRDIMVKVVNEDLFPLLKNIKASTLLIWGEKDTITPVEFGHIMEKEIPDAGLVVLKNAGHFSYLDQLNQFLIIIDNFLEG